MADGLRVGPVHRASSPTEVERLAAAWLDEHRPTILRGGDGWGSYDHARYVTHIRPARHPEPGAEWEARIEARWTPTPQRKGVAS